MFRRRMLALFLVIPFVAAGVFLISRLAKQEPPVQTGSRPGQKTGGDGWLTEMTAPRRRDRTVDPTMVDYVGSDACRDCHSDIWEKYRLHPMANSFARVEHADPIEDYSKGLEFSPAGHRKYRVERSGDEVQHHEIMVDANGEVVYDEAVPIAYILGSGKRGRGYVIDRDGLLFKSSISWYSDTHQWGLSPDYLPESHMRFERRVTGGCLACHSGLPNFTRGEADRFKEPSFLEEAIGCERCHGPGRQHVAFQNSGDTGTDPIVNPRGLDMDRREAICAQCHLRGETRILRTGRMPHDFRPGERLEDNWIVFVKSHGSGITRSGRAATQAEHMVSSVCFQKSEGRLGCTSCHDPHAMPNSAEKDNYYRRRCLECHSDRGCSAPMTERQAAPYQDRCTACHMPSISSDNVLHRSNADHRILRRPDTGDDPEPQESIVFQFADAPIPEHELRRAKALKMVMDAMESNNNRDLAKAAMALLKELVEQAPDDLELYVALGNCAIIQNLPREAEQYWSKVLKINPRHEQTLQTLAVLYHDNYQFVPAERTLKAFIEMNPWHGTFYGRLASTLMHRGDTQGAIAAAERGLEVNPSLWKLHEFLGDVYAKAGDREASERHRAMLSRMRPREDAQ